MKHARPLAALACLLATVAVHASPGGMFDQWKAHRDALRGASGLLRLYAFDGIASDATTFADSGPEGKALSYAFVDGPGNAEAKPRVVEGRWPGKTALRLDRGYLSAAPFDVSGRAFTVTAWLKITGEGSVKGDAVPTGGTLLSMFGGYWDGMRVTLHYPDKILGLEIGRPQPSSAVGIHSDSIADGVYHHLAATWDGQQMRLYLDGIPVASGEYAGAFTPASAGGFRIGFSGFGWGSCVMDVDEVVAYGRALSSAEVLRDAYFYAPFAESLAPSFDTVATALEARDFPAAEKACRDILKTRSIDACLFALAHLRLGQALLGQQRMNQALAEFDQVMNLSAAPDCLRAAALQPLLQLARTSDEGVSRGVYEAILKLDSVSAKDKADARLRLAGCYRHERNFAAARKLYAEILKGSDMPMRDRLNLMLQVGHTAWEAGDLAGARAEYAKVAATAEAPPQYKSYALLRIAQSYVKQKQWAAAAGEYSKLAAMTDVPAHHAQEARECLAEVKRLQAGQPARDPNASRTKLPARPAPSTVLYVATGGSDANPGTPAKPLATLAGARDAIRALRQKAAPPPGGVEVILRPGEYRLTDTFKLEAQDTGSEAYPITYRAEKPGTVTLTGGTRLKGFSAVTDPAILGRLPEASRGKVLQIDLKALGITDFGKLEPRGFGHGAPPAVQLFFNGKPMTLARWPNEGFVKTGKVITEETGDQPATFAYTNDRLSRWAQARDVWLFGYWRWLWADEAIGVASIDAQAGQIKLSHKTAYGVVADAPFYAFNLLEELDQPGEWYLDRETGLLYFYPPSDPATATIQFSVLSAPMIQADDVSYVTFQGLTLELGRSNGIVINKGSHCLVAGCTLRQLGGTAVTLAGGSDHGILGCDMYTLGRNGTWVSGGDRKTLTPGRHFVENCDIHDFSVVDRTYTPAVYMEGVGNIIRHNEFHNTPCHSIRLEGNDHIVEYNNIHDVVRESDDQGGLDIFLNPSYRGNIFRYNFWHNIGNDTPCGRAGVRLDDAISGVLIYGNVFYRSSGGGFGGVQIHGGKENILDNNLFIDCKYGVSFSPWGEARWKQFLNSDGIKNLLTKDVDIASPPYSTRYPALAHLAENPDAQNLWRNVVVNCGEFTTRDRGIHDLMENYVTLQAPGFVDAAHEDFGLKPNAPIFDRIGFRPIPFDEIGLYKSDLRPAGK